MAPLRHLRRGIKSSFVRSVQAFSPAYWRRISARFGPVQPLLRGVNGVGEGAVWSAGEEALYWADIVRGAIFRYRPAAPGQFDRFEVGEPVVALALTEDDGTLLVALGSGLKLWRPYIGQWTSAGFDLPEWPDARLNDGRADPAGRFWIGSMGLRGTKPVGRLFSIIPQMNRPAVVKEWRSGIGTSNTACWSPDRRFFYFADSQVNTIWRYAYDQITGDISGAEEFFSGFSRGEPDGSAVDAEGNLWNCRAGGGCIVRIDPGGNVTQTVEMPVYFPATCTFGGQDLRTLFITSGRPKPRYGSLLDGSLFALSVATPGLPENRVRLS